MTTEITIDRSTGEVLSRKTLDDKEPDLKKLADYYLKSLLEKLEREVANENICD